MAQMIGGLAPQDEPMLKSIVGAPTGGDPFVLRTFKEALKDGLALVALDEETNKIVGIRTASILERYEYPKPKVAAKLQCQGAQVVATNDATIHIFESLGMTCMYARAWDEIEVDGKKPFATAKSKGLRAYFIEVTPSS
eukprot:maker-scaffold687_size111633-snap-gene-0.30 protein:Tk07139 transcript:maker-scaffold687_size111633-snap-gene-0.30-mRNA-1 annotation:"PREDICTED: uncharacterized protein LOC100175087"